MTDEQRIQAYLELIQALLSCPNGEESQILQAHQELLDESFLAILTMLSQQLQEEGSLEQAEFLTYLNQQLTPLIMGESTQRLEDYRAFLEKLLIAEIESNFQSFDAGIIYSILQQHQHLLDETFAEMLQEWALQTATQDPEKREYIAGILANLCIDIEEFPLGIRSNNLEIAIKGNETVLTLFSREALPLDCYPK